MNDELLAMVEREVLGWPGVSKETGRGGLGQGGFGVPPATVYRFGRRALGHIHDTGVADLTVAHHFLYLSPVRHITPSRRGRLGRRRGP